MTGPYNASPWKLRSPGQIHISIQSPVWLLPDVDYLLIVSINPSHPSSRVVTRTAHNSPDAAQTKCMQLLHDLATLILNAPADEEEETFTPSSKSKTSG